MRLTPADRLPVGPGWTYELKWDGYRGLATIAGGRLGLRSRTGTDMLGWFPDLAGLGAHVGGDAVLDGEVVVLDAQGQADFGALRRPGARRTYVAFDLLAHGGEDVTMRPLRVRRRLLARIVADALPLVVRSRVFEDGPALLALAEQLGLEGVVAKRADSVYRWGERSANWVKVKTAAGRATMARRHETWGS
jgi:bifunctional non-homologous end joining protein LigD